MCITITSSRKNLKTAIKTIYSKTEITDFLTVSAKKIEEHTEYKIKDFVSSDTLHNENRLTFNNTNNRKFE